MLLQISCCTALQDIQHVLSWKHILPLIKHSTAQHDARYNLIKYSAKGNTSLWRWDTHATSFSFLCKGQLRQFRKKVFNAARFSSLPARPKKKKKWGERREEKTQKRNIRRKEKMRWITGSISLIFFYLNQNLKELPHLRFLRDREWVSLSNREKIKKICFFTPITDQLLKELT